MERRRRGDQPLQAERDRSETKTDSIAENRIGENRGPIHFEQYSRMAKPRGVKSGVRPRPWIGLQRGRADGASELSGILFPEVWSSLVNRRADSSEASETAARE